MHNKYVIGYTPVCLIKQLSVLILCAVPMPCAPTLTLRACMLVGVSRLEAAVAEDQGEPSDTNTLTLAAALDQLALV